MPASSFRAGVSCGRIRARAVAELAKRAFTELAAGNGTVCGEADPSRGTHAGRGYAYTGARSTPAWLFLAVLNNPVIRNAHL